MTPNLNSENVSGKASPKPKAAKKPAVPKINVGGITAGKIAGAKTVTVGLKSPNGIVMRLFTEELVSENTPSGPRTVKQFIPNLEAGTVTLKGYGGAAFGVRQAHRIVGQYALTENVDGDFMRAWLKQNKDHELVRNNLIFIQGDVPDAESQGKEQIAVWDGLHPLRMRTKGKKDPRVPKKVNTMTKKDDDDGAEDKEAA